MADKRLDLLREVFETMVSEKDIRAVKKVQQSDLTANNLEYQYLEAKGYIKIYPKNTDNTISIGITVDGIGFYEDVKDIAPAYWREIKE
ncbi:hypothetical protein ABC255_08705 [Neobacillus sp. 3P2-tot-E-2]|uniref:hypothetical protein n=1 Tax=Neobacillus sp. 3P2-tot-E-2 TaxID=3132212 RepID=UPI0039A17C43